jgi:tetratricopeptide (TPR) repeat protein
LEERNERVSLIWYLATCFLGIFLVQKQLDGSVNHGEINKAILYLSAGILTPMILTYLFIFIKRNGKIVRNAWHMVVLLSVVITSIAVVGYKYGKELSNSILSPAFLTRVKAIGTNQSSVQWRLEYYSDALEIFSDYPITGGGGGAWKVLYKTYQNSNYNSLEIHSHILQVVTATGALGLFSYLILIFALIFFLSRSLRRYSTGADRKILAAVSSILLVLLLHSQFDFDMSIPFIAVYFWILVGIVIFYHRLGMGDIADKRKIFVKSWLVIILLILNFIVVTLFYTGMIFEERAIGAVNRSRFDEAESDFSIATRLNPLNEIYPVELAYIKLHKYKKIGHPVIRDQIEHLLEESLDLGINDFRFMSDISYIYFEIKEFDKAMNTVDALMETRPLMSEAYLNVARLLIRVAQKCIMAHEYESANRICEYLQNFPRRIAHEREKTHYRFYLDAETLENINQSKILLEQIRLYNFQTSESN